MYIGTTGVAGLHHLVWEVFDNSRDEAMGGFCNDIEVALLPGNVVRVADNGRGIPVDKMTLINGVRIPSIPGTCYHSILCALAENKDKFCPWSKVVTSVEKYMRMYGGNKAWKEFSSKHHVKPYVKRIKENAHTLTRSGKDCYGYRLHERGMCIYFFKDGAILFTGGKFVQVHGAKKYDVKFPWVEDCKLDIVALQ